MKNSIILLSSTLLIIVGLIACNNSEKGSADKKIANDSLNKTTEIYTCPMDTDYHSDKPGTCPKCGMDLEKNN
jgi:Cu(I)/Ag(I) efflux system membrane fusion protein